MLGAVCRQACVMSALQQSRKQRDKHPLSMLEHHISSHLSRNVILCQMPWMTLSCPIILRSFALQLWHPSHILNYFWKPDYFKCEEWVLTITVLWFRLQRIANEKFDVLCQLTLVYCIWFVFTSPWAPTNWCIPRLASVSCTVWLLLEVGCTLRCGSQSRWGKR